MVKRGNTVPLIMIPFRKSIYSSYQTAGDIVHVLREKPHVSIQHFVLKDEIKRMLHQSYMLDNISYRFK